MEHKLSHSIVLLTRTPATLNALLRDLPEPWTAANEGENTWSVFDVVGHLIHGERTDWMPRAKRILEFGESKPFDPFDRLAQNRESQGKSLPQLLDEFATLRTQNLMELRSLNLQSQDFQRRGRHPAPIPEAGHCEIPCQRSIRFSSCGNAAVLHRCTRLYSLAGAHEDQERLGDVSRRI